MKEVKLELSVVEINTILKALGQFPYNQVSDVIAKIHHQASIQVNTANGLHENEKASTALNN